MLKIIKYIALHRKVNRLLKDIDVQLQSTPSDTELSREAVYNCRKSLKKVRAFLGSILDLDLFDPAPVLRYTLLRIFTECHRTQYSAYLARGKARGEARGKARVVYVKYRKSLERIGAILQAEGVRV